MELRCLEVLYMPLPSTDFSASHKIHTMNRLCFIETIRFCLTYWSVSDNTWCNLQNTYTIHFKIIIFTGIFPFPVFQVLYFHVAICDKSWEFVSKSIYIALVHVKIVSNLFFISMVVVYMYKICDFIFMSI